MGSSARIAFSKDFFVRESVRESIIEKYLVAELNRLRKTCPYVKAVVKKIGGPGWRGWPDRMVLFAPIYPSDNKAGCTHWLEVKRPRGGKFEPLQLRMHRQLRGMDFVVRVVNTKALVDEYIAEIVYRGPHRMWVGEPVCLKPPNSSARTGTTATVAARSKRSSILSKTSRASKA